MTTPFKHENVIKLAGVLGVAPELRLTTNGNAVATLIVYTNYILRNDDGSTRQESERHRVIVWGLHAEKVARLLRKGSKIRVQGRMTYRPGRTSRLARRAMARRSSPRRWTIKGRTTRTRRRSSSPLPRPPHLSRPSRSLPPQSRHRRSPNAAARRPRSPRRRAERQLGTRQAASSPHCMLRYWRLPTTVYNTPISAEARRTTMGEADCTHSTFPATSTQALRVDGLPPCALQATADGTWHVTAQLAADEQAALASAPAPDELCRRAQHTLGLAGIGSRIAPDHTAIGVYAPALPVPSGVTPLVLDGRALLWSMSHAPSESIRALIAAAIEVMRAARDA